MAQYVHPKRMPSNEDRIYKARQYEMKLQDCIQNVKEYKQAMCAASFAAASGPKNEHRSLSDKLEAIRMCREKKLQCRRARLQALLDGEEELLQDELKTTTMGLAERRQWLEARARALKQKRLQENDKYAAEQLNRAWRDNADDIRIHDSKLSVLRAVEGRKRQLEEAVARKILEEEEGRKMEETMAREWHLKEQALLREIEMKEAKKIEAIDILDEQLYMMNALRKEEKDAVRAEMAAMNAKWKQEEEELKLLQHQQRCYQLEKAKAVDEFNKNQKGHRNAETARDKQFEADCMAMTAAREAAEILQEKELKDSQRREAKQYAAHLQAIVGRLAADESIRNAAYKAEEDAEWAKKEAGWKREEDQRKRLWDRVHEERQQQLLEKEKIRYTIEENKRNELEHNERMAAMQEAENKMAIAAHKKTKQGLLEDIEEQIRNKQAAAITVKEQKRVEFEDIVDQEKKYADKVKANIISMPFPEPNFKHKLVKWYED
ncbi:unnamed protein product [Sphagnum balticum]